MSKYNSRRVAADGYTFDSVLEYQRYLVLRDLERREKITDLGVHPLFEIHRAFRDRWGRSHKAAHYVADFLYWDVANTVWRVEDAKGVRTAVYKLKLRLFLDAYREHDFREVTAKDVGVVAPVGAKGEDRWTQ